VNPHQDKPMDETAWNELSHAVIDRVAGEDDARRVSDEIAANPVRAREFARLAMLHDAVDRALTSRVEARGAAQRLRVIPVLRRAALVAAVIALAFGAAWLAIGTTREASASDVLARLIEVARSGDRTYFVRALDAGSRSAIERRNGRPAPSIDGAVLSMRLPASYVLARLDGEGGEVLTGSDGTSAWIVPARGPVRVSRDPRRFSGALPGSKSGVAFVDPHGDFKELAASYELRLLPPSAGMPLARIVATRRSDARGGPRRVEIAYEPETSLIRVMRLENLPQARGGPRSVEFELVDDAPLDARFFSHESHHGADRAVIEED